MHFCTFWHFSICQDVVGGRGQYVLFCDKQDVWITYKPHIYDSITQGWFLNYTNTSHT